LGDSGVGKSSLILRIVDDSFGNSLSTIGAEFKFKSVHYKQKVIRLQLWDIAGPERYRAITSAYFRNASVAMVVYDVSDRRSFDILAKHVKSAEDAKVPHIFVIGNKIDLDDTPESSSKGEATAVRVVSTMEGEKFCRARGLSFIEMSAKSGQNARLALRRMMILAYEHFLLSQSNVPIPVSPVSPAPATSMCISQ